MARTGRPSRPTARTHRSRLAGGGLGRPNRGARIASPTTAGRWSLVHRGNPTAADRLAADVFAQLDRYGVVTRGSVMTENAEGGFGAAYRALSRWRSPASAGAATSSRVWAPRSSRSPAPSIGSGPINGIPSSRSLVVLAACDPANPYGAALPWPEREGHRPGRKAGALVVMVDGALVFYVERGGKTLLSFTDDPHRLAPAAAALARSVQQGHLGKLTVERADGGHVFGSAHVSRPCKRPASG